MYLAMPASADCGIDDVKAHELLLVSYCFEFRAKARFASLGTLA